MSEAILWSTWLEALKDLMVEAGIQTQEELRERLLFAGGKANSSAVSCWFSDGGGKPSDRNFLALLRVFKLEDTDGNRDPRAERLALLWMERAPRPGAVAV